MAKLSARVWALILLFSTALILGGMFIYSNYKPTNPLPPSLQNQLPAGLETIKSMTETYPNLIKGMIIQQQIEGTLKDITNNSWTLEQDGQTITLTQGIITPVQYYKLPKIATNSAKLSVPVDIKATDIKTGDRVVIYQILDYQTGKTTVTSVTLLGKD